MPLSFFLKFSVYVPNIAILVKLQYIKFYLADAFIQSDVQTMDILASKCYLSKLLENYFPRDTTYVFA